MHDCIFCAIIAKQSPANIVEESASVIVFLALENHPLVVPKQHIPNLYAMDNETACTVMQTSIQIAKAVKKGLEADGVLVRQANEAPAGQVVFHYHMHLYPTFIDNAKRKEFLRSSLENRQRIVKKLQNALINNPVM